MVAFWSSVALMTGRYHGRPVPAHARLPIARRHFERWLGLFRETAHGICPPRAPRMSSSAPRRIARSLHIGIETARGSLRLR